MKAVDFIIEFADCYLFIEVKDPDQSPRPSAYAEFAEKFERGKMDDSLKYKYRDSFLYEWAAGRADKPVDYLVLVALESLDRAQLIARGDELQRVMPTGLPRDTAWKRPIVRKCGVFNIASWNENFPDFRVERVAARSSDPP